MSSGRQDERRRPADFLDEARGPRRPPDARARVVMARHKRELRQGHTFEGHSVIGEANSSPRMTAFAFAAMAAFDRRVKQEHCCEHALAAMKLSTDELLDRPLLHVLLGTGHAACSDCAGAVLPPHRDRLDSWRCDICETESDRLGEVAFLFGCWQVHGHVCSECAAFYDQPGNNGHRARWEDVLDAQVRLLDLARRGALPFITNTDQHFEWPPGWQPEIAAALLRAEPVYVTADVQTAWLFAHEAFEPEPIRPDDPFTPAGLAVFPSPVELLRQGTTHPANAVLWYPRQQQESLLVVSLAEVTPRQWGVIGVFMVPFGVTPDAARDGLVAMNQKAGTAASPDEDRKMLRQWAMLQAFWRMAQQFVRTPERSPRPQRRAAQRAQLAHDTNVTVIRLRRQRQELPESEGHVDWSCRWLVRGHWRHLADGRQTYVQPHVKGPDDKPFRVTERVWEFVR